MKRLVSLSVAVAAFVGATVSAAPSRPDEVIPLIQMDEVPLTDALRQMARKAHLNVLLDPRLSEAPYKTMTVSIRWENITVKEALGALLDNYGLAMVESSRSRVE